MVTNKLQLYGKNYSLLTNKLQTIWLELLDVNKQTTNYMARTTRCFTNYMARTTEQTNYGYG